MIQRLFRHWPRGVLILVGFALLLSVAIAPAQVPLYSGSTYTRGPEGYGAWYAWAQDEGMALQRWQRPAADFPAAHSASPGQTFLQIYPSITPNPVISPELAAWIRAGNTLVQLGIRQPVTAAPFHRQPNTPWGAGEIDTRRRKLEATAGIWTDPYGAIAWRESVGNGEIIRVITPFLAANAYQARLANFQLLAHLVLQPQAPLGEAINVQARAVWVDEYLHGYEDEGAIASGEAQDSVWGYLARTALAPLVLQGAIASIIALIALNRRFGLAQPLASPVENNSQAYIQALASVLAKAEQHHFVLQLLSAEKQRQLQHQLGLGSALLAPDELRAAWVERGRSLRDLNRVLLPLTKTRLSTAELRQWLQQWDAIASSLSPGRDP
jgi:hypothetical protein